MREANPYMATGRAPNEARDQPERGDNRLAGVQRSEWRSVEERQARQALIYRLTRLGGEFHRSLFLGCSPYVIYTKAYPLCFQPIPLETIGQTFRVRFVRGRQSGLPKRPARSGAGFTMSDSYKVVLVRGGYCAAPLPAQGGRCSLGEVPASLNARKARLRADGVFALTKSGAMRLARNLQNGRATRGSRRGPRRRR